MHCYAFVLGQYATNIEGFTERVKGTTAKDVAVGLKMAAHFREKHRTNAHLSCMVLKDRRIANSCLWNAYVHRQETNKTRKAFFRRLHMTDSGDWLRSSKMFLSLKRKVKQLLVASLTYGFIVSILHRFICFQEFASFIELWSRQVNRHETNYAKIWL